MQTNPNLNELFFPIKSSRVFTHIKDINKPINIPGKKALLNGETNIPISIVSEGYKIITNEEAYNYGLSCLKTLFELTEQDKIVYINSIKPKTLSFCHIDLTCPEKSFNLKKDKYIPFVRITNSYNGMLKLRFRVGVCRLICGNGMIFGEDSIKFSFAHTKSEKKVIRFDLRKNEIKSILDKFKSDITILVEKEINNKYAFPLFCKAFGIKLKNETEEKKTKDIHSEFSEIFEKYCKELGNNFYSLYNTITEVATNGLKNDALFVNRVNSRQNKAGNWLREISDLLREEKIDYDKYLEDYLELLKN